MMVIHRFILRFVFYLVISIVPLEAACTHRISEEHRTVTCNGITSEAELGQAIKLNKGFNPDQFVISESELRFISHDTFRGTKLKGIEIEDTTLMALTDTSTAFEGLEDSLEYFRADRCNFVGNWNWNHLRNLKRIKTFKIYSSRDFGYLSEFPNFSPDTKKEIYFSVNQITDISPKAFSAVKGLSHLSLMRNQIKTLKRSCLPQPAESLEYLDLSNNKIQSLPEDMFVDMPVLKLLYISHNQIRTLDEKIFKPIWKQLASIDATENGLICDCRLKWTLSIEKEWHLMKAVCENPSNLIGKDIRDLENNDLYC